MVCLMETKNKAEKSNRVRRTLRIARVIYIDP